MRGFVAPPEWFVRENKRFLQAEGDNTEEFWAHKCKIREVGPKRPTLGEGRMLNERAALHRWEVLDRWEVLVPGGGHWHFLLTPSRRFAKLRPALVQRCVGALHTECFDFDWYN